MKNFYFMVWADAILSYKKHHPSKQDWKFTLLFFITWINALNCWILFIWLKFFDILNFPLIRIDIFPGDLLDKFFSFTIMFALPFGIINYLLIFNNNRYERIIKKYKDIKFRSAPIYSFTIIILAFFSAILLGYIK